MRLALMSDVHLEFGPLPLEDAEADVLLLAGDIFVASDLEVDNERKSRIVDFIEAACAKYKHVIHICGNHEHYHGDIALSEGIIRENFKHLDNFIHMNKEWNDSLGDVTFIGGTLWTDMNKEDPVTIQQMKGYMNDYRIINDSNEDVSYQATLWKNKPVDLTDEDWLKLPREDRVYVEWRTRPAKWSPEKSVVEHRAMMETIKAAIEANPTGKFVVVGHHAPSKASTKPGYEGEYEVNGAYSSDLSEFILDHPQIKLWVHGHTHTCFDYMVGTTRVVSNPRGYLGYERDKHEVEPYVAKVIEL